MVRSEQPTRRHPRHRLNDRWRTTAATSGRLQPASTTSFQCRTGPRCHQAVRHVRNDVGEASGTSARVTTKRLRPHGSASAPANVSLERQHESRLDASSTPGRRLIRTAMRVCRATPSHRSRRGRTSVAPENTEFTGTPSAMNALRREASWSAGISVVEQVLVWWRVETGGPRSSPLRHSGRPENLSRSVVP
jgi:hypothetical protein